MRYFGEKAIAEMEKKLASGELTLPGEGMTEPGKAPILPDKKPEDGSNPFTDSAASEEPSAEGETEQPASGQASASGGGGIDLSYASQIASIASGADIAAATSAVLGCLSAADKAEIASLLASGRDSEAYGLVYSRISGDAYATLVGLYYKYLPMVQ